ncbi:MAG: hypothetical protein IPM54_23550 [Polyangiaceae bacterium]|nr:hypothetical protein [Polyangiaceae bacterium]
MTIRRSSRIAFLLATVFAALTPIACDTAPAPNDPTGSQSASSSTGGAGGNAGAGGSSNGSGGAGASGSTSSSSSGAGGSSAGTEILHADFEKRAAGMYSESMVEGDFGFAAPWNNGLDEGRATIVEESGNRFLRVTYPANEVGPNQGGVQFKVPFGQTFDELYLSYRVRFAEGFQFVKGGKIPGLVGGSAPTGCVNDTTGFSARMMWRSGGGAVQYMYFPEKQNPCGDDFAYDTGNGPIAFQPGTWHTVEHRIVMNTPGENDGVLEAWFDGASALSQKAFSFRLAGATFGIDTLYFSTFFGGSDASWAPTAPQMVDFDDFVVSTGPITH